MIMQKKKIEDSKAAGMEDLRISPSREVGARSRGRSRSRSRCRCRSRSR